MKKVIIIFIIIVLFVGGYYLVREYQNLKASYHCDPRLFNASLNFKIDYWKQTVLLKRQVPASPLSDCFDNSKEVTLQQVNNLSYVFYIGQVDYPNAPAVSDDIKNQITKIAYNAKFPKTLLKTIPIVIVNSLAVKSGQYLIDPTTHRMVDVAIFGPDFLNIAGKYATYDNGLSVIYINKIVLDRGILTENLTHELGHAIGDTLTDQDWEKYYQLRNIPKNTPEIGKVQNSSPVEDFAEVYRSVFTASKVGTIYGAVNSQTKNFIIGIVNKLNQK
jgi:hypothetical protein